MEITLEKIELVKDRTGVSYKEAKAALEQTDGNVVDAIIFIEEGMDVEPETAAEKSVSKIIQDIKAVIRKGNAARILVKKEDEVVVNIPVNAGILGIIFVPWASLVSTIAALGLKCTISVVKNNGEVVNIVEKAAEKFGDVRENCSDIYDGIKEKGGEAVSKVKQKAENVKSRVVSDDDDDLDGFDDDYFNFDDDYPDIDECSGCCGQAEEADAGDDIKIFEMAEEKAEDAAEEAEDMFRLFEGAEEKAAEAVEDAAEQAEEAAEEIAEAVADELEDQEIAPEKIAEAVMNDTAGDLDSIIDELINDDPEAPAEIQDELEQLLEETEKFGAEAEMAMKDAEDAIEDADMMSAFDEAPYEEAVQEAPKKRRFRFFK